MHSRSVTPKSRVIGFDNSNDRLRSLLETFRFETSARQSVTASALESWMQARKEIYAASSDPSTLLRCIFASSVLS